MHQVTHEENPHSELLTAEEQFPSAQVPSLSLLSTFWPKPRVATPGEPLSDQLAVHPSSVMQTTAPESHASLPVASASSGPPQVRPSPLPGLPTQPLWTSPLSLGSPQAVPNTGYQQLAFTASQAPAQVPASIHGKVQCSEYINLSDLLTCDFQYKYNGLDDDQTLEIVDGKLSLAPKCKSRHLFMLQLWLKAWHIYEDTILSFLPSRYQELSYYQCHIAELNQCFNWAAVLSYDAQFHHRCAMQGLLFSAFDQQLYVTTLDATAAKVSSHRCFRCQQFDHKVIDCPNHSRGPAGEGFSIKESWLKASRARKSTRDTSSSIPSPRAQAPNSQLSFTKVGRSASNTSTTHAPSTTAEEPISAGIVSRSTQLQSVVLQMHLPLNLNSFKHYLACHPDRWWNESLLQGICKVVDIGYQGDRKTIWSRELEIGFRQQVCG